MWGNKKKNRSGKSKKSWGHDICGKWKNEWIRTEGRLTRRGHNRRRQIPTVILLEHRRRQVKEAVQ